MSETPKPSDSNIELIHTRLNGNTVAELRALLARAEASEVTGIIGAISTTGSIEYIQANVSIQLSLGMVARLSHWLNKQWDTFSASQPFRNS